MRTRTIIAIAATVALIAGGYYAWENLGGHEETAAREAVHSIEASELLEAFTSDEEAAMKTFVGSTEQVVQVDGRIRAIEPIANGKVNIVLDTGDPLAGVVCEFDDTDVPVSWRSGAQVSVKGICTGMLMDVVLVRCAAVNG